MIRSFTGRLAAALALAGAGFALGAATKPAPKPAAKAAAPARNWAVPVLTPQGGYLRGKPDAQVKLVEFVSYTCPHCAHFEVEADAPLTLGFIGTGKGSVEVRPYLRNVIDVSASLLTTCGAPARFHGNHTAILRAQDKWLRNPTQGEVQRWNNGTFGARMRAIASDLGLYKIMLSRGYTPLQLDRCLADEARADKIANQTQADTEQYKIQGTPSFLVNGTLQDGVHDWAKLRPVLQALTK